MSERVLIDNDVVLKVSCYDLVAETLVAVSIDGVAPAMLGVGRYVVRGRLAKAKSIADKTRAARAFESMLAVMGTVEPDEAELSFAADLEAEAIRRDLELDGGESQLLAMLANRKCDLLLTGDKRAISAMAAVAAEIAASRIACLEQLVGQLVAMAETVQIQPNICAEPQVDRAISACFGCSLAETPTVEEVLKGLASYIRHLQSEAPGVLLPGVNLSKLAV